MATLYLIAGESGSGKDTLVDMLCRRHPELCKVISSTTRPRRTPDENTHLFLTEDEYHQREADMVAATFFCGAYYGAEAAVVNASDFYIIDPVGIRSLRRNLITRDIKAVYITASEDTRRARMMARGQSGEAAEERIVHDRTAFAGFTEWDAQITNEGDIETALAALEAILHTDGSLAA